MENITSFFFNIIPGTLLIFILKNKAGIDLLKQLLGEELSSELNISGLIILSIIIGFFMQAATKIVKEKFLYHVIWCKIRDEDPDNFDFANNFLIKKHLVPKIDSTNKKMEKVFFVMDNYLSLRGGGRLLTHFASRFAYWSNLFWASLIIVALMKFINDSVIIFSSALILILSGYLSFIHLKNHYDILLKSFVSFIHIDRETKK